MDRLREIVADFETDNDPLSREEVEAARTLLRRDQRDSGGCRSLMPGTLLLDSESLSKLYLKDRTVLAFVQAAWEEGIRVGTTAMTTLEADHERIHPARIRWVLSRIDVHDVTKDVTDRAAVLLRGHRLSGHRYAIDAVLAALARTAPGPVTVLTSDPADISLLCGPAAEVIKV